ncbi:MAG: glycosyltransferase family 39 protein [Pyrinomonadaceae bacterium]
MEALLLLLALLLGGAVTSAVPVEGSSALVICVGVALFMGVFIARAKEHRRFLLRLFVGALLARMLIGSIIYILQLENFFGGDAYTYDGLGYGLLQLLEGHKSYKYLLEGALSTSGGNGWGMAYLVAGIYKLVGRNMLATQYVNSVLGATTAPVVFLCAQHIFNNPRVSRLAGIAVAFYPSLVLWSAQGLKDGPIVFTLCLSILAILSLGNKFSFRYLVLLLFSLFALLSLRFYVFYMMVAAVGGAFVIGMRPVTAQSFVRQFAVMIFLGLGLTYFGVSRSANAQLEKYGNLEAVQISRSDMAHRDTKSGFGKDVDVSTTSGALSALPTGVTYLLLAPFPWQLTSLRQSITFPEMALWWLSFPLLILGLWFTVQYRLRQASPILIFTSMLTLAYSLFQGNVGTAYRQRSQLLVFYFIFVAVGFVLLKEQLENRKRQTDAAKRTDIANARRSPETT